MFVGFYFSLVCSSTARYESDLKEVNSDFISVRASFPSGAPNGNFRENICSEDDLRSRIFGAFVVKFIACLPLLGFSNIYKMV